MEILGIGPGEFFFILIILLVVVGPERLPDLARQAGKLLVRGRNWLQNSPDAAMVMRARQELDQELANLRASLLEVQSVRDEVLGAAKQIGAEVNSLTSATKAELEELGTIAPPKPDSPPQAAEATPANGQAEPGAEEQAPPNLLPGEPAEQLPPAADTTAAPDQADEQTSETPRQPLSFAEEPPAVPASAPQTAFESIDRRLDAIMRDLFALQEQLKQRGVLADDWRPPSFDMQMPTEPPYSDGTHVETKEAT